jgi:hypothetical protein
VDIEGAEYEVLPAILQGAILPRWISIEIHYFQERGMELLELLRSYGYRISGGTDKTAFCATVFAENTSLEKHH